MADRWIFRWQVPSQSDTNKHYTVAVDAGGTYGCDCWAYRRNRSCKHIDEVKMNPSVYPPPEGIQLAAAEQNVTRKYTMADILAKADAVRYALEGTGEAGEYIMELLKEVCDGKLRLTVEEFGKLAPYFRPFLPGLTISGARTIAAEYKVNH